MERRNTQRGSLWLHGFAVLTACATGLLIVAGGLVTSHEAALAVPDWPTTYGHNMFTYPTSGWVGGIFYEHGHRLLASGVGLLTVILAVWIWKSDERTWMHMLAGLAVFSVVGQGVLGGLRVIWLNDSFAVVHACLAQAFFALAVALAVFTGPGWRRAESRPEPTSGLSLRWLAVLAIASMYMQTILGAFLRHADSVVGGALHAHLAGAGLVLVCVAWMALRVFGYHASTRALTRSTGMVLVLLVVQIGLGFASLIVRMMAADIRWPTRLEIVFTTAHVAVGALLLAASMMVTLWAFRLIEPVRNAVITRPSLAETVN